MSTRTSPKALRARPQHQRQIGLIAERPCESNLYETIETLYATMETFPSEAFLNMK
jgi:hypothetical protein